MPRTEYENFDLYSYFYDLVKQIPRGKVATYGDLARALGDIRAARACGYMLSIDHDRDAIPGHRVIHTGGRIGKYTSPHGEPGKETRLESEGIHVYNGQVESLGEHIFSEFETDFPLKRMKEEQESFVGAFSDHGDFDPESLCAVDVSYDGFTGIGSAIFQAQGHALSKSVKKDVNFPYIPGYLSYREYPFIKELCRNFDGIVLVDGNGLLHYRSMGLATFAGVLLDIATIGVAKSKLFGVERDGYIMHGEKVLGYRINRREIISPGNKIGLDQSIDLIRRNYGLTYPPILKDAHNTCTNAVKSLKMRPLWD